MMLAVTEGQVPGSAEHKAARTVRIGGAALRAEVVGILDRFLVGAIVATVQLDAGTQVDGAAEGEAAEEVQPFGHALLDTRDQAFVMAAAPGAIACNRSEGVSGIFAARGDRKSTRLNSSHANIS